ncbi:MAG TPA: DUF1819 family protein, partial [Anaerolineae bacterium]|nr:DUF1819 family protein [Anaerolineae bacterium]
LVREQALRDNLLQMRTTNSAKRIFSEISSRLRQLTPAQMELLLAGSRREQHYLLWLAYCKRYRFVYDFAVTVLREKFLRRDMALSYAAYDIFFSDKAEWHPEVARVAEATRRKQRQFLFRIMRETELLTGQNEIVPAVLSPRLTAVIRQDNPAHLAIYPVQ